MQKSSECWDILGQSFYKVLHEWIDGCTVTFIFVLDVTLGGTPPRLDN